jgi:hypothetical protein
MAGEGEEDLDAVHQRWAWRRRQLLATVGDNTIDISVKIACIQDFVLARTKRHRPPNSDPSEQNSEYSVWVDARLSYLDELVANLKAQLKPPGDPVEGGSD